MKKRTKRKSMCEIIIRLTGVKFEYVAISKIAMAIMKRHTFIIYTYYHGHNWNCFLMTILITIKVIYWVFIALSAVLGVILREICAF